ncbi:hypothetical protein NKH77_42490 [Streptomyces sp. M19]
MIGAADPSAAPACRATRPAGPGARSPLEDGGARRRLGRGDRRHRRRHRAPR